MTWSRASSAASRSARSCCSARKAGAADAGPATTRSVTIVPDDFSLIEDRLHHYVDEGVSFIFTTGGTGLTPDDVTPEASMAVITREAPGIADAMRAASARHTPMGILSRAVAGVAVRTLIVNFPGSPKAVDEVFGVVAPVLAHAAASLA